MTFVQQERTATGRMTMPGPHAALEMIMTLQAKGVALVVAGGEAEQLRRLFGSADKTVGEFDLRQTRHNDPPAIGLKDRRADEPHLAARRFRRLQRRIESLDRDQIGDLGILFEQGHRIGERLAADVVKIGDPYRLG